MKYERLIKLQKNWLKIPKLYIYKKNLDLLNNFNCDKIILRSSYKKEDSSKNSFAWIFISIWWIDKQNISKIHKNINFILKDASIKLEKLGWNVKEFDIIIQEYINTDLWGVIFVENDKILIEINSWAWAEKVVEWDSKQSLYFYKKFRLSSWEELLNKELEKKILENIKKIKSIYNFNLDIEFWIKNNNIFIFQVRPIIKNILNNYYILDNSNIWENFTWTTTKLTASFVKRLYSKVYKSVAHNSWISYKKIAKVEHIFDDLIVYKNRKIYYNIISWYKFLLLFPWDNKKAFDSMIWTKLKSKYLYIDDVYDFIPKISFKIKYVFILIYKIFTFDSKIKKLENYLDTFYKDFEKIDLKEYSLNDLYLLYKWFEQNLSYLWYITIDNDFVIMKMWKNLDLWTINWLISAEQVYFLGDVANNKKTKKEYLERYGHRFWDELKLESPDITERLEDFDLLIEKYKNIKLNNNVENKVSNFILKYIKNREKFRLYRSKNFSVARKIFLNIWEKFVEENILKDKEEIFDLEIDNIFDKILENNKVADKNSDKFLIWSSFEGKIYIMKKFHIPNEKIEIIIAESFDPWWIVLLPWIKWIILENGNMLSHVSIICRELNIPLLMWIKDATKKYSNWDYLEINSNWNILCKNI
jgi:pyruvate,water dikinase